MSLHGLIDVPIESLPYVDEHATTIVATPNAVWNALVAVTWGSTSGPMSTRVASALGCVPIERSGKAGEIGSTVPGFVVTRAVCPAVLALMGEHRFSCYALIFTATDTPTGLVELRVYRTLVIGSRGHVLATRSILRAVRRRAERAP